VLGALRNRRAEEQLSAYIFLLPSILILTIFIFYPILFSLFVSLKEWSPAMGIPVTEAPFVGLDNYTRMLIEPGIERSDFYRAVKNNLYYVLGVVPTQTFLALLLAVIVNQKFLRGRTFFRTAFYFPSITSSAAISLIFLFMYQSNGLINQFLTRIIPGYKPFNWIADPRLGATGIFHLVLGWFGINIRTVGDWATTNILGLTIWDWLSGPSVALTAIMLLNIWTTLGTLMLIYLAALQDIPSYVYEAAAIDGASGRDMFWRITVPLLKPTTLFVVTTGIIGTWQVFDQVYVMSQGGPSKTTLTLAFLVWTKLRTFTTGPAAALAFILFGIIAVFTLVNRRLTGGDEGGRR
jgi:multiple sugar transport system permease protein